MSSGQLIYWGLLVGLSLIFAAAIWISFFADPIFEKRGKLAEARLGKRAVKILISTMRVLGLMIAVLSAYLIFRLIQIFPCAMR